MAVQFITYIDKIVNGGISTNGRWLNADANQVKTVVNNNATELANKISINDNISLLNNDVGYLTAADLSGYLQTGDNISLLNNDAGYLTIADLPSFNLQEITNSGNQTTNALKTTNANNIGSGSFSFLGFQTTTIEGILGAKRTGVGSSADIRLGVSTADEVKFTFVKNTGGSLNVLATIERNSGNVAVFDGTVSGSDPVDLQNFLTLNYFNSQKGAPNGIATLDSSGTVPITQLPDSVFGQMHFGGTYDGLIINASSNYPELQGQPLPAASAYEGVYFISTSPYTHGGITYADGDWIVSTGVDWTKIANSDAVTTVFGRNGNIVAVEGDYQSFYPRLSQSYNNPSWINTLAYSKITGAPDLSAYLSLAGGTMAGNIEMASNAIYTNNFFYVRNNPGHTPYVTLANARSGTNEMRLEWGIPYGSGSGYAPFKIALDYDNPSNGLTIQTPSTLSTSSATPKLVFNIGDNITSPNMTVAQFYGSVLGRMPTSVGDGSGYPGDFATKPYVDSQVGNYLPLSAGPTYPLGGDLFGINARFTGGGMYEVGFAAIESSNNGWHVLPAAVGGVAMGYVNNMGYLEAQSSSSFTDGQYRLFLRHSTDAGSLPLFEIASKATYSSEYTLTDPKDLVHKGYIDDLPGFGLSMNDVTEKLDWGTATSLGTGFMRTITVPAEDIVSIGNPLGPEPRIYVNNTTGGQNVSMRVGASVNPVGVDVSATQITVGSIGGTAGITVNPTTGLAEYRAAVNLSSASDRALVDKGYVGKMFSYTTSGDGVTTTFSTPHGLTYTPTAVIVAPNSEDVLRTARLSGTANGVYAAYGFYATADATNVNIIYPTGTGGIPPAGTNNLTWTILVK